MGFDISSLIGGSIGDAFQKIVGVFKIDPTMAFEKKAEIEEIQLQLASKIQDQYNAQLQAQTDIDKQEAASGNWFAAGWRPAFGWIGAAAFGINYIVAPLATWGSNLIGHPIQFPSLDMAALMPVTMGMLGLGAYRTYEKVQGVDTTHPNG